MKLKLFQDNVIHRDPDYFRSLYEKYFLPLTDLKKQVEGKSGQGKNGYNLSKVKAISARTSKNWITVIFIVMNQLKFSKNFFHFQGYPI